MEVEDMLKSEDTVVTGMNMLTINVKVMPEAGMGI